MNLPLLTTQIRSEPDVVFARQRARQIAGLMGFDGHEQTRIATAVSEIARNAFQYAKGGSVGFTLVSGSPPALEIRIRDEGPGIDHLKTILEGRYSSPNGMGMGITGARRLMDDFQIDTASNLGTTVVLRKKMPANTPALTDARRAQIAQDLARSVPQNPLEEIQNQNQELLRTLDALRAQQAEMERLNRELEETNRGVMALTVELEDKAVSLQQASEMKSRFLSNIGHEIRTPINAVLSLSHLLLDRADGELTPEQEKQVRFIRSSGQSLAELVSDLLDLARIEAGKTTLRTRVFAVSELMGALRGMFRPLHDNAAVLLVFEDPPEEMLLNTDEGKLGQILRNFISNALKFTEQGSVRVQVIPTSGDLVVFAVSDTGIGIAPKNQERIFEEFAQIENPLQARAKGTGLGLPLSRKLAELLGGRVRVQSESGKGSTFTLEIPRTFAPDDALRDGHVVEAETKEEGDYSPPMLPDPTRYAVVSPLAPLPSSPPSQSDREAHHA